MQALEKRAKDGIYISNVATIKKYGENKYKLTYHKTIREQGWEGEEAEKPAIQAEEKLSCNIARAKGRIYELAMCNPWENFITCTLDPKKYERSNLKAFNADLSQFIRDKRKSYKTEIKALMIPEQHADGKNWHMHGLITGIQLDKMADFMPGKAPRKLIERGYKNWPDYARKFGFVSLGAIQSPEAVSAYITKYINKSVAKRTREIGAHLFYSSHGLKGAELTKKGTLRQVPSSWDFENDYVKIIWIQGDEINKYI